MVAVALISYLASRAARSELDGELRYGAFITILGSITALAMLGVLYVLAFVNHGGQYVPIALITAFCAGATAYFFAEGHFTRGTYDAKGICFQTLWTGRKEKSWHELRALRFNASMGWYLLTFDDGVKMRIPRLLNGHALLLKQLASLGFEPDGTRRAVPSTVDQTVFPARRS
jgi:hypothetical protein